MRCVGASLGIVIAGSIMFGCGVRPVEPKPAAEVAEVRAAVAEPAGVEPAGVVKEDEPIAAEAAEVRTVEAEPVGVEPAGVVKGELRRWHRVTVDFDGPHTSETAEPNPFRDYRLMVTFRHRVKEKEYVVPGFYAADGDAANTGAAEGDKWRVHFAPDEEGVWTYRASFRTGTDISTSLDPDAGEPEAFDDKGGRFRVGPTDKSGRDFRGKGALRYVGRHHLRFAETGEYYLKGGADSPENFLGYYGFDGTYDMGGGVNTPGLEDGLHRYEPHAGDWNEGDPDWGGGKGRNIIGALNYLSSEGMNSVYFLTFNAPLGDGRDTWMWLSPTDRLRYDVSKLDQWEIVFSHMDAKGIQLHFVTSETENDTTVLDERASFGTERRLYYRELVARFGHHLNVIWNIGEENDNSNADRKRYAAYIRALDQYAHPITVHTHYGQADRFYDGLLGDPHFEATSIQGSGKQYNHWAESLRRRSREAGRPWVIYGDEQGPAVNREIKNLDTLRTGAFWGNLMGGGAGVEWYWGYQGTFGDVQSEDWRVAEPLWEDTAHALGFFQTYLPFWQMEPRNDLVSAKNALCLARPGEIYATYLPKGGTTKLDLGESTASFTVKWFDPREGGELKDGSVSEITGPGKASLGEPPDSPNEDWAVLVQGPPRSKAPVILSALSVSATVNRPLTYWIWADGAEPIALAAEGLPAGLILDGCAIRGTLTEPGTFEATVTATNEFGTDTGELRITFADAPPVTEILFPADGAELVEGGKITLKGRGRNLSWSYDANSDKKGRIQIGKGPEVEFEVPMGVVGARTLTLTLTGSTGAVTQNHKIVAP